MTALRGPRNVIINYLRRLTQKNQILGHYNLGKGKKGILHNIRKLRKRTGCFRCTSSLAEVLECCLNQDDSGSGVDDFGEDCVSK